MIFPADWPLEAACPELRALYVALNSPVVRQDPLPVGPASAAVALHRDLRGVSVAIRSVRTGQVAFFTTDPEHPPGADMAVDAALSFAETLGFVFDENEVAPDGGGAQGAARLWCDLIGEDYREPLPSPPAAAEAPPAAISPRGEVCGGIHGQAAAAVQVAAPTSDRVHDAGVLTRFRWALGPTLDPDAPQEPRSTR